VGLRRKSVGSRFGRSSSFFFLIFFISLKRYDMVAIIIIAIAIVVAIAYNLI
jgi:hypothetical protein